MRVRAPALLCELHAHTTWSDGELSLPELVNLYGSSGFDVLCITDHVLREDDPWPVSHGRPCINPGNIEAYLHEVERERARALSSFGLLLVPGLELTYNDPDPDRACHAVAVGVHQLVAVDDGPVAAMETARASGAAVIVAHPHELGPTPGVRSPTRYFSRHWRELNGLFDRVELFNGDYLFGWVADKGLSTVACGDLHRPEQFPGWTTLIPCEHECESLVEYLRSRRPVYLTRLELARTLAA